MENKKTGRYSGVQRAAALLLAVVAVVQIVSLAFAKPKK